MRGFLLSCVVLLASCDLGSDPSDLLEPVGDTATLGITYWLAFDASDAPVVAAQGGVFRFDGASWVAYPAKVAPRPSEILITPGDDIIGVERDSLWRYAKGSMLWEPFDGGVKRLSRLAQASDGTLYALQLIDPVNSRTRRVWFRGPGDAAWTDSKVDVSTFCWPIADHAGNVWCESSETGDKQRVARTVTERFPRAFGVDPATYGSIATIDIDASGVHWGTQTNYSSGFGIVRTWTPSAGATPMTDGVRCHDASQTAICQEPKSGFVNSATRRSNGEIFHMWSESNGGPPYLMRQSGAGDWQVVLDMYKAYRSAKFNVGKPGNTSTAAAFKLQSDKHGRLYAYSTSGVAGTSLGSTILLRIKV